MLGVGGIGFVFLCEDHLREWAEGSKRIFRMMWRCLLIRTRYRTLPGRCRDDGVRSAATRRHTLRTCVVSGSANLEKTGLFLVKTANKWLVFQCTVN